MRMRKQMMDINLPIYNNVRQSSSIVMSLLWQKIAPVCASAGGLHLHGPAADSLGLRLWLPPCRYSLLDSQGLCPAGKLSAQSHCRTAEMHVKQAVSFINIKITVYREWTVRLKILIFLQSEISQNKISTFQKTEKPATFLTLHCNHSPISPNS